MTIATASEQYSHGYRFARKCMCHMAKTNMLPFEPQDNYVDDVRDAYHQIMLLEIAMLELMGLQKTQYRRISRHFSQIYTRSQFRDYCIRNLCPLVFCTGYSSMNFINFLAWVIKSAVDIRRTFCRNFFLDAMLVIGDAMDIFIETAEYGCAGGWDDLYDAALKLNRQTAKNYLKGLARVLNERDPTGVFLRIV